MVKIKLKVNLVGIGRKGEIKEVEDIKGLNKDYYEVVETKKEEKKKTKKK